MFNIWKFRLSIKKKFSRTRVNHTDLQIYNYLTKQLVLPRDKNVIEEMTHTSILDEHVIVFKTPVVFNLNTYDSESYLQIPDPFSSVALSFEQLFAYVINWLVSNVRLQITIFRKCRWYSWRSIVLPKKFR